MNLSVDWPNGTHFLLQNPTVTLEVDGTPVPATLRTGGTDFTVPKGTTSPAGATLTVTFTPSFTGTATQTLRVRQNFRLLPPLAFGGGGPLPLSFEVRPTGAAADVVLVGQHPLLSSISALGLWRVLINTNTVDVTALQPIILSALNALSRPATPSNVRILARTDGKLPFHWITATNVSCTQVPDTDVLCFLTAPQGAPKDRDDTTFFVDALDKGMAALAARAAIFLAGGVDDDTFTPRARDHFARANNPGDAQWKDMPQPNVVLARGWESALVASTRHVALALPVPSDSSHNAAATAQLPALMLDVHATLVALGDIAGPDGTVMSPHPLLGVAAHSNGGAALFAAVAASPSAFKEVWLFDTNDTAQNLPTLARSRAANVLFAGFDAGRVVAAHAAASSMPSLSSRIRRLPDPAPSTAATPAALAASSSALKHALEGGGMAVPASSWTPGVVKLPTGETFVERFEVLHQQIVQGNDSDGLDFLTKAFNGSSFR